MTLYRCPMCNGENHISQAVEAPVCPVCINMVPVEPEWEATIDYGKAEAMFQVVASTAIGLGLTPAVRAIVDAALGFGETP